MAVTYAVYYGMTALSCLFAFLAQRTRGRRVPRIPLSQATLFLILAALPMIFVSGFRWDTGVDSQNYYWVYTNIYYGLDTHVEIGFRLLCRLLLLLTEDVSVLFFVCAVLTVSLVLFAIRRESADFFWSVFLFLVLGYFFYSMNSIRHYLALALYLAAFRYLRRKKFLPYAAFVLAAACFHKIALIALPLYFLLIIRWKPWWYLLFTAAAILAACFHRQLLDFIYQFVFGFYQDIEAEHVSLSVWNIFVSLVLSGLCLYYRRPLLERDSGNVVLLNAAWMGLIFFVFFSWIPDYTRIGQYCLILILFLVPEILTVERRPVVRRLYIAALLAGGLSFLGIMIWQAQDPHLALAPYHSLLFRDSYPLHRFWF